jgi:acetylornithine deacetylase/succinyl-diaminopimelate desuccinylase-like protein
MEPTVKYVKENRDRYIEELKALLRIPSVSAESEHKEDMYKAAQFIEGKLHEAGIKKTKIYKTAGHPILYGEWLGAPGKPTVLVYGHYDVQPAGDLNLWETNPFEPVIKGDKLFARGATDDKGQLFVHIKSVEAYFKTVGTLPVNVKFLLEGEEEIGSENLDLFIVEHKDLLKCDTVVISDTSLFAPGIPTLTYGLRGLCYMEIELTGPNRDLHSGTYGGAVANPVNMLAKVIAQLHDKNGKITIPGFYDDVLKLTKKERENFKKLKFSEKAYAKELGVAELQGEAGFTTLERTWARPTLDCNGIVGGYYGEGAKTIIPSKASSKISMRLVPHQDPKKIEKLFTKYIKTLVPKSVKVTVKSLHGGYPVVTPIDHKATVAASTAMERAFGKKTVYMKEGGSIPIVATFSNVLKAPTVLMGIGLDSENLHSPNEHFSLTHFMLGIESSVYFLEEFSK